MIGGNRGTKGIGSGFGSHSGTFEESHAGAFGKHFQRAVVIDVVFDPASLTQARRDELRQQIRFSRGIDNIPRNSIIARRVKTGETEISGLEVFYPFLPPQLSLPVKAGEQVWVFFEDPGQTDAQGFWAWRISEQRDVDDLNHTHADRKFDRRASKKISSGGGSPPIPGFHNGVVGLLDGDDVSMKGTESLDSGPNAYKDLISGDSPADAALQHDYEEVPRFTKRPGDAVLQGSNNALLVLTTDRSGAAVVWSGDKVSGRPVTDQIGKAGAAIISVGRGQTPATSGASIANDISKNEVDKSLTKEIVTEGDIDLENDLGTFVLSMSTKADANFSLKDGRLTDDSSSDTAPAAVLKSNQVRLVAREDIKLIVKASKDTPDLQCASVIIKKDGNIVFLPSELGYVMLGGDDANLAVLCQQAIPAGGQVTAPPTVDSMGATIGAGAANGQYALKVLLK